MTKPTKLIIKLSSGLILFLCFSFIALYFAVVWGVFGRLPAADELAGIRNEEATLIFASDGSLIGKVFASNRTNIKWNEVPPQLVNALICTEDKRFFSHEGIDRMSYLRVLIKTLLTGDRSSGGGSTLTQQLVKNLYGRKDLGILTLPVAKIKEAVLAYRLEKIYSKNEIILLYLNSIPFGENVFGIEAAAQRFFAKNTSALNAEQSALLVGMLKANTHYNPRLYPDNALKRRNQVLQLMEEQNYLSPSEADSLKNRPLELHYSNYELDSPAGYFDYQVTLKAEEILAGMEAQTGKHYDLKKDGLKIYTTLDPELQKIALQSVQSHLALMQKRLDAEMKIRHERKKWEQKMSLTSGQLWEKNPAATGEVFEWKSDQQEVKSYRDSLWHYYKMLHAAVLMIEPGTGKVRAWIGGNNFRFLPYDLVLSHRQIASAFKPILYTTALEKGLSPCTYLDNEEKDYEEYDDWHPRNYDNTSGNKIAMWYALAHSINLPTVDLYFRTGFEALNETCRELGLPVTEGDFPSVALGSMDISLKEIVTAYGAFANSGTIAEPVMIESITDADGNIIYGEHKQQDRPAIAPEIASQITAMLERAVNEGTGSSLRSVYQIHSEIAGKTGTAQDYSDAWFISYTPKLVIGTWVGAMDPNVHFHSQEGSGSSLALPIAGKIWTRIENTAVLRSTYIASFQLADSYFAEMDCEPVKEDFFIKKFFKSIIDKNPSEKDNSIRKNKKSIKEKGKVGKFFDKLFKKKEK